jgi:ABC-type polysaccharide/polyol phosphate transport system ATPase subunit
MNTIELQDVSLSYRVIRERPHSFQEYVINYVKGKRMETWTLWALRDISLAVVKGESLGIIGSNGAGKSTLLKVVSGVIKPQEGRVRVKGSIGSLIELGAGFDPELTGRENIYLNAAILGFSKQEIDNAYHNIIEFAELQDFIGTPLKNYSSGMVARLGFSIATEIHPDILIIDEVLAVGDAHFNKKSKERIEQFKERGITILFVSHDMEDVRYLCDRVVWLTNGKIQAVGTPEKVIADYLSMTAA